MSDIDDDVEVERSTDNAPPPPRKTAADYQPIELDGQGEIVGYNPTNSNDLMRLVDLMVAAGVCPEAYFFKNTKKADKNKMAVGILAGRELGYGPMMSLRSIMVVRGMPCVWGDGLRALVMKSGTVEDYREYWIDQKSKKWIAADKLEQARTEGFVSLISENGQVLVATPMALPDSVHTLDKWPKEICAYVAIKRYGVATHFVGEFSVSDAIRAKLWLNTKKQTYYTYPQDMLMHRAQARAWSRGFSDCTMGVAIREIIDPTGEGDDTKPAQSLSYLGVAPAVQPALTGPTPQSEADMLLNSLAMTKDTVALAMWEQAAEGTITWLNEKAPELAKKVTDALAQKKEALAAVAQTASTGQPEAKEQATKPAEGKLL